MANVITRSEQTKGHHYFDALEERLQREEDLTAARNILGIMTTILTIAAVAAVTQMLAAWLAS